MSLDRSRRALELAESLVEESPDGWEAELRRIEPDDGELREEVLRILTLAREPEGPEQGGLLESLRGVMGPRTPVSEVDIQDRTYREAIAALKPRYRVEGVAGRGGSSLVLRAHDSESGEVVAIKLMVASDPEGLPPRARREHRIGRELTHPGIVPIIGSGRVDDISYLVMPFIEGGTLRDRIADGAPLSIPVAVRITLEASRALAYAHAQGVVHRDIKPENFMMLEDRPLLADFGIARETTVDPSTFHTSVGHVIGTVAYMSPEQAAGRGVDARSDLYSMGCVLYELLTGEPPFLGVTLESIMNKHLMDSPGSPQRLRPTIPDSLVRILDRLLAKTPADRFPDAAALVEALERVDDTPVAGWRRVRWRQLATTRRGRQLSVAGVMTATVIGAIALFGSGTDSRDFDRDRIAVFPASIERDWERYEGVIGQLVDELNGWDEIGTVDSNQIVDIVSAETGGVLSLERAAELARQLGAGRFVLADEDVADGANRFSAAIYPSASETSAAEQSASITFEGPLAEEQAVRTLSDRLLSGPTWVEDGAAGPAGTRSRHARRAYAAGLAATRRWDLTQARDDFRQALLTDPDFAAAHLAMARARHWRGDATSLWAESAQAAMQAADDFGDSDRLEAIGLAMMVAGRYAEACEAYAELTADRSRAFVGWFGQGECRWRDSEVVADPASPSGWGFRSSQTDAVRYFETAFRREPASLAAFRARSFDRMRARLVATSSSVRLGQRSEGEPRLFLATPMLIADTLAYVPYPLAPGSTLYDPPPSGPAEQAQIRQRAVVRDLAALWLDSAPGDPDAMFGLAIALEMLADPAAIDSLERARSLETRDAQRREVAATQAWVMIKQGAGTDTAVVSAAGLLADSLLGTTRPGEAANASLMASLAAVSGRSRLATEYLAQAAYEQAQFPEQLERAASEFTMAAATGESASRLAELEGEVWSQIDATRVANGVIEARSIFVERGAMLAFPDFESRLFEVDHGFQSPIGRAQSAWHRRDLPAVERELTRYREELGGMPAASVTIDALYPESRLLLEVGDTIAALDRLVPALTASRWIEPGVLRGDPVRAAVFVRALEEAGLLGAAMGHPMAAAWTANARSLTQGARNDGTRPDG